MSDADRNDVLDAALDVARVPAHTVQGNHGHDAATEYARGARLLRLRAARMTYTQIANEEGYADAAGARNALIRALKRHEAENVLELRTLENLALDADERTLRTIAADTSQPVLARVAAVNARTRLSARRARLNGLDAPIQVELSADDTDAAKTLLIERLMALRDTGDLPVVAGEVITGDTG